jgi:hypothetical protein
VQFGVARLQFLTTQAWARGHRKTAICSSILLKEMSDIVNKMANRWIDCVYPATPPVVSFPFKWKMSIPLVVFSRIDRSMAPSTITWGNLGARCARRQKLSHVRPVIATRGCLKPYFLRSRGGLVISAVTCRPISPTSAEMWWIKLASNRAQSGYFLLPIGARKLF